MKHIALVALLVFAASCKVEKTGQDTYKVVAPTPQAKAAAEKAKEKTQNAVQKLGAELKEVGDKAKAKTEEKTETTSTVETETGTKTETRSKTTKHH